MIAFRKIVQDIEQVGTRDIFIAEIMTGDVSKYPDLLLDKIIFDRRQKKVIKSLQKKKKREREREREKKIHEKFIRFPDILRDYSADLVHQLDNYNSLRN